MNAWYAKPGRVGLFAGVALLLLAAPPARAQNVIDHGTTTALIPTNQIWNFLHPTNGIDPAQTDADFHATWFRNDGAYNGPAFNQSGPAVLGYGTIDLRPVVTQIGTPAAGNRRTAYFTTSFQFNGNPAAISSLVADLLADDGAFIYLNGQLLGTHNIPNGAADTYTQTAAGTNVNGTDTEDATFVLNFSPVPLVQGSNFLAVSVHNADVNSSDLGFELALSGLELPPISPNALTATLVPTGSSWRYLDTGNDPGANWQAVAFNDSAWRTGVAELGYAQGSTVTEIRFGPNEDNAQNDANNKIPAYFFRHSFSLPAGADPSRFEDFVIDLRRDDGAAVYVNGQRVILDNLAADATFTDFAPGATNDDGDDIQRYHIDPTLLQPGVNVIAAEVHQSSGNSSDLTFELSANVVTSPLKVLVNTVTGAAFVVNDSGLPIDFDGYSIQSTSNNMNADTWFSFQERQQAGGADALILGPGTSWSELNPRPAQLAEFTLSNSTDLANDGAVFIGQPLSNPAIQDLGFDFLVAGAAEQQTGDVDYFTPAVIGDVTGDGFVTAADIDQFLAWQQPGGALSVDVLIQELTGDGRFTQADVDHLVRNILGTQFGDINLDGRVSIGDLTIMAEFFGTQTGASWAMGDFDGNGAVSIGDLTVMAEHFGFDANAIIGGAPTAVPLPATGWAGLALVSLCGLLRSRRARMIS